MRPIHGTILCSAALALAAAWPAHCAGAGPATAGAEELRPLADRLREGIKDASGMRLAVLDFAYTDGRKSAGPAVLRERLTTLLAQDKGVTLIERSLLEKVLGELKLQASGVTDGDTARRLGAMLGATAVLTGTLNDLDGGTAEVNARIIDAGTGKILSAAGMTVKRAWEAAPAPGPGGDFSGKPLVQLALLLDTSNSMDGLINQARAQLWKIINELNGSEKSGSSPVIEVALYEYGNSGLDPKTGWVRQVLPFTRDLDRVSEQLFALKTNGGDEYCGKAVGDAVSQLAWSAKDDVYKAIFIAGNEPFTQGTVDFRQAVALAKSKGIFVNTIFCGRRQEGQATQWAAAAQLADGEYANIDQSAPAAAVNAPQDAQIARLSGELDSTYVVYGTGGSEEMGRKRKLESSIAAFGAGAISERGIYKAMAPAPVREQEASWDVITALENGSMKRSDIKKDQLPEELRKLDRAGLEKAIDAKLAKRREIRDEITRLNAERNRYMAEEEKKRAGAPATLDKAVLGAVRSQAVRKGYKFAD